MGEIRLGDIIDDYCVKCKRLMNHAVVSLINGEPAKVRCRTCHNDHDYRHEMAPPPKVDARKQALFNEVLAKVAPSTPAAELTDAADDADFDEPIDESAEDEAAPEAEAAVEEESALPEEPPIKRAKPAVKAKAKPKAKPKVKAKAKGHK